MKAKLKPEQCDQMSDKKYAQFAQKVATGVFTRKLLLFKIANSQPNRWQELSKIAQSGHTEPELSE